MSLRVTLATSERVLRQLRHDRRTIALVLVVPSFLLTLFRYVFDGQEATFDRVGGPLVGIFPLVIMFLITSIAMLRERTTGTLERLMSLPLAKLDLLLGYGIAFALVGAVQAVLTATVALTLLDLDVDGSVGLVIAVAVANAVLGTALGLFLSAFAKTEFQAVQFMPAAILPQLLLCGLFVPRERMADLLEWVSWALPMTYAYEALSRATTESDPGARLLADVAVVAAASLIALALGAALYVAARRRVFASRSRSRSSAAAPSTRGAPRR